MSILHSRIVQHGGQGATAQTHPWGTGQTRTVTPAHAITYQRGTGYYQSIYPSKMATGDVNAVPVAVFTEGGYGSVVPAGRP